MLKKVGDWVRIKYRINGLDTEGFITRRNGGYVYVDLKCVDLASKDFGKLICCEFYDCEIE